MNIFTIGGFVIMFLAVCVIIHSIFGVRRLNREQDEDLRLIARMEGWEETDPDEIYKRIYKE